MPDDLAPFAAIIVGTAGSGKSTVARAVARRTHAVYLDKDALAGPLVDAAMRLQGESTGERENNAFYRECIMPAEYEALFAVAEANLSLGHSVVIDAPFAAYVDQPDYLRTASADWPSAVRTFVVVVSASEEKTKQRLIERDLSRDQSKLANWPAFWAQWGALPVSWLGARRIDIRNDEQPDLGQLVSWLHGSI
ncbi:AAA family ATPase [Microbacterium jiangjiandongii]|uniref:AAA family ATPase n=1 Tax=Microbacterium jiangjiandongii TaxID=3049071 RepID=UPI00214B7895|nr:ATP-binding protein [Microbacterium sp. zg.Y843]MCR2816850.1 ATP-binding protein [Microbacterium sp. zg.Y843]